MSRILSSLLALAMCASLGTVAVASTHHSSMMGSTKMSHSCPKGQTWVKGYTKKDGTKVKGYCRKSK